MMDLCTKNNSVWCAKLIGNGVATIQIWFRLTRFRKDFSTCREVQTVSFSKSSTWHRELLAFWNLSDLCKLKAAIHYATFHATVRSNRCREPIKCRRWVDGSFWLLLANGCPKELHVKLHRRIVAFRYIWYIVSIHTGSEVILKLLKFWSAEIVAC